MQVWNVLRAACWKCRTQNVAKSWTSANHRATLSGYIFATKACIDNRKKVVKQQYLLHMSPQYGELRPTSGWDRSGSLGHPSKFQWVSRLGSVTARQSSIGHQPNFAALNRGRHLYSAGRPSRWALAHISSLLLLYYTTTTTTTTITTTTNQQCWLFPLHAAQRLVQPGWVETSNQSTQTHNINGHIYRLHELSTKALNMSAIDKSST